MNSVFSYCLCSYDFTFIDFKNGGMLGCSAIFCKSFYIKSLVSHMLSPSEISDNSFFLESKSRKPLLETICLSDMDPVYSCEMNVKPPMESMPTKDFNVFVDL